MKQVDSSLAVSNLSFAGISANNSAKEYTISQTFTIADDKTLKPWKLRISENNNSLSDADGSVTAEGIKVLKVSLDGSSWKTIIDLSTGTTSGFNNDGLSQYTEVEFSDAEVSDGNGLDMKVYIKADVVVDGNLTTIENGNGKLADNEIIAKIKIYDVMGNTIPSEIYVQGQSA
jgi:hypothetical protein